MAEKTVSELLLDRLVALQQLVTEQQALILALFAYQREQPSYDARRLRALFDAQRVTLKLPPLHDPDPDAILQELLKRFEGPIH